METAFLEASVSESSYEELPAPDALFYERYWIRWAKFATDVIALQAVLPVVYLLNALSHPWFHAKVPASLYLEFFTALLLVPCGLWLGGLYPGYGLTLAERLRRRVRITSLYFLGFTAVGFLVHHGNYSRLFTMLIFLWALVVPPITQSLLRALLAKLDLWGTPVLVLGGGRTGERVVSSLLSNKELGFRPVAILDDDKSKWGQDFGGVRVAGGLAQAQAFKGKLHYVLFALPSMQREKQVHLVNSLPFSHVLVVPDLIGVQSLWVETRDLSGVIGLEIRHNLLVRRNMYFKLFLDYFLGVPLFLLSLPILTVFAVWVYLMSPGNPFYCQVREGWKGSKFKVWKLRTMHPNAEKLLHQHLAANPAAKKEWEANFKLKDDPRIIKGIGNFLRKSSIDELPQLWNVLRGEMSLVGPRPFPHYHLEQFDLDFRRMRRSVLPGMTGLWQVSARSDGNLEVQEKLDTYYILNWSIWLDLSVLGQTFRAVVSRRGAC